MHVTLATRSKNMAYWEIASDRIKLLSTHTSSRLVDVLKSFKPIEDQLCVASTGSDGRLEKGLVSRLEVILYHRSLTRDVLEEVDGIIRNLKDGDSNSLINGSRSETKDVEKDDMSYAFRTPDLVYPSRVLDSYTLHGNPDILLAAKLKLLEEWTGDEGKRILKHIRSRKKTSKRVMNTGIQDWKGTPISHYDLVTGVAHFQDIELPEVGKVQYRSFKSGPLRFVQVSLEQDLAVLIRILSRSGTKGDSLKLLKDLPTPTVEKLEYLADLRLTRIPKIEVADIIDCYLAFLHLYHTSENLSREGHTEMQFDIKEVRERIELLARLLTDGIVKHEIV